MRSDFDVLVIGGGLVGASLACALAGSGRRIGLVEAVPFAAPEQPSFDERTTAIAWGSRRLLERWGLWADMADEAAPIRRLKVSQAGHFGVTRVDRADYGVDALGYVLPNRVLGRALFRRLEALDSVELLTPVRFEALARREDGTAEVTVRDEHDAEHSLRAALVVGADGARSRVREALGIGAEVRDYGQGAVVSTIRPGRAHADTAFERFLPDGPLAVLPRTAESCAVVWTLPTEIAEARRDQPADAFLADLQAAFGYRLGPLADVGERFAYPLKRVIASRTVAERAVLVGNAGHNLHPAAAQGFNLALRDVAVLADAIGGEGDPGEPERLRAWAEARRPDQHRVTLFTDRIVRLFSNRVPGLGAARAAGLIGLELKPEIKHDMARRSMGLAVDRAGAS